jgi:5-methylcytosine-specific restriction endonuclease McrA
MLRRSPLHRGKPRRRKKTPRVFKEMHREEEAACENCGTWGPYQLHHRIKRSQGGKDTEANLQRLCVYCHQEAHGIRVMR